MTRLEILIAGGLAAVSTVAVAQVRDELPNRAITRAEVLVVLDRQFKAMDRNHDGKVTPEEFAAYRDKQRSGDTSSTLPAFAHVGGHWFEKSDVNGDGIVTPAEAAARPMKFFDMADSNRDGVISLRERQVALAMMSLGK